MNLTTKLKSEAPYILVGLGVTSGLGLVFSSVKGTLAAVEKLRQEELEDEKVSLVDKLKAVWPCYIPTALLLAINVSSVLGVFFLEENRNNITDHLLEIAVTGLKEYQSEVLLLGKKQYEKIESAIAERRLREHPIEDNLVLVSGNGDVLFFDSYSGRYFLSTIEKVKSAVNDFNHQLLTEMFKPLNELYFSIGLPPIDAGDAAGWGVEKLLDIRFSAQLVSSVANTQYKGQPCIVLEFDTLPHYLR